MERTRANTTAVEGLSSLNVRNTSVILFTSNPGAKCWHILWNVRYCVGMNTTHTQPAGIPASFSQKLAILTSLVCKTKFAMVYEMDEINDVDGWTIWDDNGSICYWASIDEALIAVQKWQSEITK